MTQNKRFQLVMTEEEMQGILDSSDPGKRSEFIRQAIAWQVEAVAAKNAAIKLAVEKRAAELGFANPADAMAMIDLEAVEVENGYVTGFEEPLAELAKSNRLAMGNPKGRLTPQALPRVRL